MTKKITGEEPVSPVHGGYPEDDPRNQIIGGGLTIRQHFSAMVLQRLCANKIFEDSSFEELANASVRCADALINELNKEPEIDFLDGKERFCMLLVEGKYLDIKKGEVYSSRRVYNNTQDTFSFAYLMNENRKDWRHIENYELNKQEEKQ